MSVSLDLYYHNTALFALQTSYLAFATPFDVTEPLVFVRHNAVFARHNAIPSLASRRRGYREAP